MAEFCVDCYNRCHGIHLREDDVVTEVDLCEGCGQWKPIIVSFRRPSLLVRLCTRLWYRLEDWAWRRRLR